MGEIRGGPAGLTRFACASVCLSMLLVAGLRAEIIDRVLAVVAGELVTLSDVRAALAFGLVEATGTDREKIALDRLIDRRLQLAEVDRYVPPEPPEPAIAARLDELRARFESTDAFEAALAATGTTVAQLRGHVRDTLRIESYLQQRFAAALQPREEDMARYYRDHEAEFVRDGVLRPFAEVREQVRQRLIDERYGTLVREWVDNLRRRGDVTIVSR